MNFFRSLKSISGISRVLVHSPLSECAVQVRIRDVSTVFLKRKLFLYRGLYRRSLELPTIQTKSQLL